MRRGAPLRRTPLKGRRKQTGPSQDAVDAVLERGFHSCERCGCAVGPQRGVDHHIHHRRPRAMGGTDRPDTNLPSNLALLCPPCHDDVESMREVSLLHGWLVPQTADPALIPVLIRFEQYRYLQPHGGYSRTPPTKEGSDA